MGGIGVFCLYKIGIFKLVLRIVVKVIRIDKNKELCYINKVGSIKLKYIMYIT